MSHGFQLSSALQSYSALPLNITSGVTTIAGTAGRPIVNGAFIARNTGTGPDFFSLSLRVSRTFAIGRSVQMEGLAEGFNLTNRVNVVTMNSNFGPGATRQSLTDVRPDHRGRRSAVVSVRSAVQVLRCDR